MAARFFEKFVTFLFDVFAINLAYFVAFWIRYQSNIFPQTFNPTIEIVSHFQPAIIVAIVWIILFFLTGLYRDWYKESRIDELFVVTRTVLIGLFLLFLVTGAPQIVEFVHTGDLGVIFTRTKSTLLVTYGSCMLFFASVNRFAIHTIVTMLFSRGIAVSNVLIIGANPSGIQLVSDIRRFPKLGYSVAGFIDDDGRKKGTTCGGLQVFGTYSEIPSTVRKERIGGLIISHVSASPNEIQKILEYCGDVHVNIYMVPSLIDVISGHFKTHQIFGVPLMILLQDHMPGWQAQVKRLIDVVMSFMILLLGAPLWLMTALLIKCSSAGPAIYKQERVGQNGKTYTMLKFRSMYEDAEKVSGPAWASENDPRITPIGRVIRKTRLDEIPQFINVLKGEMSLVGPRPERPYFVEQLKKEIPWYVRRIKMKPGITGWAQVKHKYDSSIEDVKQKVLYDLYYFENMSVMLDIKIIVRTIFVVFTGKGAH